MEIKEKKLTMMIPAEIHKALKVAAANEDKTMTEIVLEALRAKLGLTNDDKKNT